VFAGAGPIHGERTFHQALRQGSRTFDLVHIVHINQQCQMEIAVADMSDDGGKDPALLDEEHCGRLASCDGVLLYWGHGREEWFHENHVDVARASRRLRGSKPFRSEAIVLGIPDHPAKADVVGHLVIRCFDGPSLDRLEPFLAPLR